MSRLTRALRWPFSQAAGFVRNARSAIRRTGPDDVLPPWIVSTLAWMRQQIPRTLGYGSAYEQMTGSIVLAIAMIVASFGILTWLAAFMLIPFFVGVARLLPVVDDNWPLTGSGPI